MNSTTNSTTRKTRQALRNDGGRLAGRATDDFEETGQHAGEEVRNLITDVEDLVGKVAHVTDAEVSRVRSKVEATLATAKDSLEAGAANVRARSRELADTTDGYVRQRPWTALGIAAAVGVVLGALSARR